ncbi:hydroxyacid dehydrogenase [Microbacterium sp. USTB-Y]|uniref:hydroxyacid dehydrogenase n=1 Tax=Microbacterium sp. USTB-Y TaxID=2823692 RepID=UPI002040851F|nr:hydroxyacid dehydrogenase [Microbacterium sp. USTB-Y]
MPDVHRPEALVVMSREAFGNQFGEEQLSRLRTLARVPEPLFVEDLDDPALGERLAGVEVLLTGWGAPQLTAGRLDRMPRLRAMLHSAGSVRPHVTEELWRRGVRVAAVAEVNAAPVAEFTLAAIVLAGKKAPFLAAGRDPRRDGDAALTRFGGLGNFGVTIGVVGFSRIGRRVVALAQQLSAVTVLVADPFADPDEVRAAGGRPVPLEELLPRVDVLSLHAPELPSTRRMISARELSALPDHATVINTARGSLIDTEALVRECAAGRLNAILDVTDPEPLPEDSGLYGLPNVMVTPHLAGSLGNELHRLTEAALDELERFAAGRPLHEEITAESLRLSA